MKLLKKIYERAAETKFITGIAESKAMAIYMRLPKWMQIALYIGLLIMSFLFGMGCVMITDTIYSYGANMYAHHQMTQYGVVEITDKTPRLPEWMTDSFKEDGFEIVIRPDSDFLQEHEYTEAYFSASEKLVVMRKDYDGFVPYHEMGHYYDWKNDYVSLTDGFQEIYEAEADDYCLARQYYSQTSSKEYFASCFAMYFMYPNDLERVCPLTYQYIDSLDLQE